MSDARRVIQDALLAQKDFSPSTLRTYTGLLLTASTRLEFGTKLEQFADKVDDVLKYVDSYASKQSRKTLLAALYGLTGEQRYRTKMQQYSDEVGKEYAERRLTGRRAEQRITYARVKEIVEERWTKYNANPSVLNANDLVIACLTSGFFGDSLPPRRLEWHSLRWKKPEGGGGNYLGGGRSGVEFFHLNDFKTAAAHKRKTGSTEQRIAVPDKLRIVLMRLKRLRGGTFVLENSQGHPYTTSALSKHIQRIFGQGISVDQLRSIFITEHLYQDGKMLKRLENVADLMGHDVSSQQAFYVKDN